MFKKCSEKYGVDIERFNVEDRGNDNGGEYSMCYNKNKPWLKQFCGPDWVFWHWPSADIKSFYETVSEIIQESAKPPTINKVGWYGNLGSPLPDVIEHKTRPLLKQIGDAHPSLFDIVHIGLMNVKKGESPIKPNPRYLSLPNLTKYKYLIDIGGNGYSGRLKFLMFSKRPILLVDRNYVEYFHDDLIPYVHYIPVKMDLSDLVDNVRWMMMNEARSLQIAQNAYEYATTHFKLDNLIDRVYAVSKSLKLGLNS